MMNMNSENHMLLFIADYPDASSERDGMMQRIVAVDSHFTDVERTYLKVSLVKYMRGEKEKRSELLTVYRLNLIRHLFVIIALALKANCIYVHSVGNALAILPLFLLRKIVTDMHGAVPEEFRLSGKRLAAIRYAPVEWVAVRCSRAIVTVSSAMAEHLRNKYKVAWLRSFNVPIFDEVAVPQDSSSRSKGDVPSVIYAGGAQAWQNVDLMLQVIGKAQRRYDFIILTGDVGMFRQRLADMGLTTVKVTSVPKSEVYDYYARADYGFVLRDDTVVNRVACPTKLVEYLACGVVPIVNQPRIGDFALKGYSYVTLENFINGELPSLAELEAMKVNNYRLVAAMKGDALQEMQRLVAFCRGGLDRESHGS